MMRNRSLPGRVAMAPASRMSSLATASGLPAATASNAASTLGKDWIRNGGAMVLARRCSTFSLVVPALTATVLPDRLRQLEADEPDGTASLVPAMKKVGEKATDLARSSVA